MLDRSHPKTPYVLAAARLEDALRARLVAWLDRPESPLPPDARADVDARLEELRGLNRDRFGNTAGIARTLAALDAAVQAGDARAAWGTFGRLADGPGENFGTWAI